VTGELYTSPVHADSILRYSIDWEKLTDTTHHDALSFLGAASISTVHNVMGGEFAPSGMLLYLSSGTVSCQPPYFGDGQMYPEDGLHVIETTHWQQVQHSTDTTGCFKYSFDNSGCSGEEPKGLTIWDLDDGRAPNVGGQLHVISYNHFSDPADTNKVFLKHYATVKVDAGRDTLLECKVEGKASVKLGATVRNGTLCGPVTYLWSAAGVAFDDSSSATPTGNFPDGATVVSVMVTEGPSTAMDTLVVRVAQTPPAITLKPDISIWPPNHKYHTFTADDFVKSAKNKCGDTIRVTIASVSCDEAVDTTGDGNTSNDIVITCPATVDLRAERQGNGDGRVYTIVLAATDPAGNRTTATAHVVVPHDHSGRPVVAGPPLYTVSTACDTVTVSPAGPQDVKNAGKNSPVEIALLQNYPNPFNPATSIHFELTSPQFVELKIYDLVGREISTLVSGQLTAGTHVAVWNAERYASGVYYYRLQTGSTVQTRKLLLMK
jgi:hypothetical protein